MDSSRSIMQLTVAFGASCGAWIGIAEPTIGVPMGMVYGVVVGVILSKVVFPR